MNNPNTSQLQTTGVDLAPKTVNQFIPSYHDARTTQKNK